MEKTQFDLLMLAITGLDTSLSAFREETRQNFARVAGEFLEVRQDLKAVREQTALNSEEITALSRGRSPSA